MHFVIMGSGRVGSALATLLDKQGHSVAVIDQNADAFRRLPANFSGRRIKGIGFDKDVLLQAGITDAYAFAAVSNGDNSNILAARVVRETFGISNVVARIYDPERASLYQKLGIPTVAPVKQNTNAMLHWMLPSKACQEIEHQDSGEVKLYKLVPNTSWIGKKISYIEEILPVKICFITRFGVSALTDAQTILQENDELTLSVNASDAASVKRALLSNAMTEEEE